MQFEHCKIHCDLWIQIEAYNFLYWCSHTFEERTNLPERDGSLSVVLSEDELHVEQRYSSKHQHQRVRDQERAYSQTKCFNGTNNEYTVIIIILVLLTDSEAMESILCGN